MQKLLAQVLSALHSPLVFSRQKLTSGLMTKKVYSNGMVIILFYWCVVFSSCRSESVFQKEFERFEPQAAYFITNINDSLPYDNEFEDGKFIFLRFYHVTYGKGFRIGNLWRSMLGIMGDAPDGNYYSHVAINYDLTDDFIGSTMRGKNTIKREQATDLKSNVFLKTVYLVCQDKRGISAVLLAAQLGTTYKTAWYMLKRIRTAMGQRDGIHQLSGVIEFDDAYFGGPTVGKKRGRGTEKAKVFVALSLDERGNPRYLKMQVTENIKCVSVKKFAQSAFAEGCEIHSDGYRSYIPALEAYTHKYKPYDPNSGLLHWLHVIIGNAKAFILGTYHGLPKGNLQSYLDEFCFRFSRRSFGSALLERLALAVGSSVRLS